MLRVKRLSEAFFTTDYPLGQATHLETNHSTIAEIIRKSNYLSLLPNLAVYCPALDGEPTTMPIIFEDRFTTDKSTFSITKSRSYFTTNSYQKSPVRIVKSDTTNDYTFLNSIRYIL